MKKAISIFLVCIMTFACIPVISFAATWSGDQTITSAATATTSNPIEVTSGTTVVTSKVTINEGATMTVKSGASLVVSGSGQIIVNGTLTIELGAAVSFVANGDTASSAALIIGDKGVVDIAIGSSCILGAGAYAYNSGIIKNIENMTVSGILQNKVTVPEDFDVDYRYTDTWNRENISVHFDVDYYMYDVGDSDLEYLNA